jgi:hypothetical protein
MISDLSQSGLNGVQPSAIWVHYLSLVLPYGEKFSLMSYSRPGIINASSLRFLCLARLVSVCETRRHTLQ